MGIALSNDFLFGLAVGILSVLLIQPLGRWLQGAGRLLPVILLGVAGLAACGLIFWGLRG